MYQALDLIIILADFNVIFPREYRHVIPFHEWKGDLLFRPLRLLSKQLPNHHPELYITAQLLLQWVSLSWSFVVNVFQLC